MNSSRPTTFSAILYWTPQSFTVLTGRDTGDVACYGIASNLRIERTARPPSTDKSLFIDAYRFRCDARGFFSFQCDKKKMKSTKKNECNLNEREEEEDKQTLSCTESIAVRLFINSGHIDSAELANRAISKSSSLDAGLVANGRVFVLHSKDVQSVNAGGALFSAATVSAHMSKNGCITRERAVRTIELRKWQCESAHSLEESSSSSSLTTRPPILLFQSTSLLDAASVSTTASDHQGDVSMASSNKSLLANENNETSFTSRMLMQQQQQQRDHYDQQRLDKHKDEKEEEEEEEGRFFLFNNELTPSRHDSAPSPIAERSGSIVDVTCIDEIGKEDDALIDNTCHRPQQKQKQTSESIYNLKSDATMPSHHILHRRHLHANSYPYSSSSSSSTSSTLKQYPGVSLETLKAAGLIEDDKEAKVRIRNEQRERMVAMSLSRSRATLEITKGH